MMLDGWTAVLMLLITLVTFCIGATIGADVIRHDCINGDTITVDGATYRAHCVLVEEVER